MSNQLIRAARELLNIESDIRYRFDIVNDSKPSVDDFTLYTFDQMWPDTTCGFGGIGGQAFTNSRVYVFIPKYIDHRCIVYIGSKYAYKAEYCDNFREDVGNKNIASVFEAKERYKKEN